MTYVNALIPEAMSVPGDSFLLEDEANGNAEVTGFSTTNQVLPGPGPGMRSHL